MENLYRFSWFFSAYSHTEQTNKTRNVLEEIHEKNTYSMFYGFS